jgi:glyoxylase-like metal-dependent hydrolase (beta-lactamase superfamily II)
VRIERHLRDGEARALRGEPGRRLRVVYTPGHAPGHCCFIEEQTGIALAGDLVATWGTILIDPSEGSMRAYLDSLQTLRDRAPRVLLPAHGGAISAVREKLDAYIEHRLWREERVLAALRAAGRARAADLVPDAYADVAAKLFPLAERSLRAHLVKLEEEGRAVRDGDEWSPAD